MAESGAQGGAAALNDDSWRELEAIFADALALGPAERSALLDARCHGRPELRREVEALQRSEAELGGFLSVGTHAGDTRSMVVPHDRSGETIGNRYRLLEKVATGGMGVVYRGERADGEYQGQVAVKLLVTPILTAEGVRRFRQERQVLAALSHPDIVTLLDGGVTESGHPYLVMTYVDGVPIVEHATVRGLPIADRVRLFQRVCAGVQHAHQNGVVHSDLKSDNILVTAEGLPKILDFGVAKLLDAKSAGVEATATSVLRPMTPNYASPEQLRGLAVTTASDIYSLGVLLYELLTASRPYETTNKPLDEVVRLVVDTEPTRPSRAQPTAHRKLPYDLRALSGDLDAIVLRALRKTASERYESAAGLADDLGRYLAGRPVEAREPSLGYVARKLASRHKAATATAGVALLVTVVFLAVSVWQARIAREERDRARLEAARAREIASFLGNLFQSANPVQARGQALTAREILDRGTERIAKELNDQSDVQASLLLTMSEAYERLGDLPKALELAERSSMLREALRQPASIELAQSLHLVGRTRRRLGRPADATAPLERALALREQLLGPGDRAVALTLRELALARTDVGQPGAREMFERAIGILEKAAPGSADLALVHNNHAIALHGLGDMDGAKAAWERALAIYDALPDGGGFGAALPLLNLGILMRGREEFETAESLMRRALAVDDKYLGPDNAGQAFVYARLGDLSLAKGDHAQAHRHLAESLRIYGKTRPPDHFELVDPLTYLGLTLLGEGKTVAAAEPLERALAIRERTNGPDHGAVADVLVPLALVRISANRVEDGARLARRALGIQRKSLSANHPALVPTLTTLAEAMLRQHKAIDARPLLEEAVRLSSELPPAHSQRLRAETRLRQLQ